MRIHKTVNKEVFIFYVHFILGERKAKVRYFQADENVICDISEDFKYVILPKGMYIKNGKEVKRLKLCRAEQVEAKEYSEYKK
jgi:hypothetical protein